MNFGDYIVRYIEQEKNKIHEALLKNNSLNQIVQSSEEKAVAVKTFD